jgi:hypothetical protein
LPSGERYGRIARHFDGPWLDTGMGDMGRYGQRLRLAVVALRFGDL